MSTLTIDAETTAKVETVRASLIDHGYREVEQARWIAPGTRVRHVGEKYPDAVHNGTAVIAATFQHISPARDNDYEVIAVKDSDDFGGRVRQWADYHCARV